MSETVCADIVMRCNSWGGYYSTPVRQCWQQRCWTGFRSPPTPRLGADNLVFGDEYPVCTFHNDSKNASNLVRDDYTSGYGDYALGYKVIVSPNPDILLLLETQMEKLTEAKLQTLMDQAELHRKERFPELARRIGSRTSAHLVAVRAAARRLAPGAVIAPASFQDEADDVARYARAVAADAVTLTFYHPLGFREDSGSQTGASSDRLSDPPLSDTRSIRFPPAQFHPQRYAQTLRETAGSNSYSAKRLAGMTASPSPRRTWSGPRKP